MEKAYFLGRAREEVARASVATCIEARLIHRELSRRYRDKAADLTETRFKQDDNLGTKRLLQFSV